MQQLLTTSPAHEQLREIIDNIPHLAWVHGPDGQSRWHNKLWHEYTGINPSEMQSIGWQSVFEQKFQPELTIIWKRSQRTGEPFEITCSIKSADGKYYPFLTRVVPMKDTTGEIQYWLGTATDISQIINTDDAFRQSELSRKAIFDAVLDCITVFDMQGNIVMMNTSAAAQYGIEGGGDILEGMEHAVQTYEMFYPDGQICPFEDWPISRIYRGEQLDDYELLGKRSNPDLMNYLSFTGSLVMDDHGKPKYAVVVTRDITDRKKAEEEEKKLVEMSQERNELLQLNRAKDEFISIASHQLRTPATAVKQYIGILQGGIGGSLTAEQLKFLTIANESNERQLKLINDLLKTAQIDSDHFRLHRKKDDIHTLIQVVVEELEPTLYHKGQHVKTHGFDTPAVLSFDATEMKVALTNLIENASKYSPADSQIDITSTKTRTTLNIAVKDHGMGIAKEDQKLIFDKFSRVNSKPFDTVSGTGLGLYLVKQIIELHGGTISVKSVVNKGSEFIVSLPL